jgi:hypothetical protein
MSSKNDPKNRIKAARPKLLGKCGHEVTPVRVVPLKGSARMTRWCETCGVRE